MGYNNLRFAAPAKFARRATEEKIHKYRSEFQRDRDRILYSKAFRRLNGKTQVFIPMSSDHLRNRLSHTLEVSQISRISAQNLGLDQDLVEAIALAHDIGHAPFGHVGERKLNNIANSCSEFDYLREVLEEGSRGFKHNLQGVRILSDIETCYPDVSGLNVTNYTLWGVKAHSSAAWKTCENFDSNKCHLQKRKAKCEINGQFSLDFFSRYDERMLVDTREAWSFEGLLVAKADEIAQRHHDVEDAIILKILSAEAVVEKFKSLFKEFFGRDDVKNFDLVASKIKTSYFLPYLSRMVVHFYNKNLIEYSDNKLMEFGRSHGIKNKDGFAAVYGDMSLGEAENIIRFSDSVARADKLFQEFLKNTILNSYYAQRMDGKGAYLIKRLFEAYYSNPRQLQDHCIVSAFAMFEGKDYRANAVPMEMVGEFRSRIGSGQLRGDA